MADRSENFAGTLLAGLMAITGQTEMQILTAHRGAMRGRTDHRRAARDEVSDLVERFSTRLGLAPAVSSEHADHLRVTLRACADDGTLEIGPHAIAAWTTVLRNLPEHVPTLTREPVVFPKLPDHQRDMWSVLLDLDALGQPWVLVGGQMTLLHCLENGVAPQRATDDGDVMVGVWTRREALRRTSRFLSDRGFSEKKTGDGYGYRYRRDDDVAIDLLLPEGLDRQKTYPTTTSGRPGFGAEGGNQALARSQRVPVDVDGKVGWVRRPDLLGALIAKAHAAVIDSRDPDRHAGDIVTLAEIGLLDPRAVLRDVRPADRKAMRRFLRDSNAMERRLRTVEDPAAVLALLERLRGPA